MFGKKVGYAVAADTGSPVKGNRVLAEAKRRDLVAVAHRWSGEGTV